MNEKTSLTIDSLIAKIQEDLDDLDINTLTPDSIFRELEGWSSLHSLVLMALVATEYSVELEAEQIRDIRTVSDLYNQIQATL